MLGNLNHPSAGASERLRNAVPQFQENPVEKRNTGASMTPDAPAGALLSNAGRGTVEGVAA